MTHGNRRNTGRSKCRLSLRYGTSALERVGFTQDVSETGMHVQGGRVAAPGTVLRIEVQLRNGTIPLQGRVAWAKQAPANLGHVVKCGMGIELIDPPEAWREVVEAWREGKVLSEPTKASPAVPSGDARP